MGKDRLIDTFIELVKIDSESKHETEIQKVLFRKFESLGLKVYEDDSQKETGLGAGNIFCRLSGSGDAPAIFLSSHSDTVKPGLGVKPQIRDGNIYSDGTTILGADDKAGIAVMLELAAHLTETMEPHRTIEFIISTGEEIGLMGAKALDKRLLQAKYGYVLDSQGPVGGIIISSPTMYGLEFTVEGKAAHAGIEPEKGISAIEIAAKAISNMKLGRIDEDTTANIGIFKAGKATNIVAEEATIKAEARSLCHEACENQVRHMVEVFVKAAEEAGGIVKHEEKLGCKCYRHTEQSISVNMASNAIKKAGRIPNLMKSGGGSDANIFNASGLETVTLAVGYEKIHTRDEYIPIKELCKLFEVVYNLATDTK